MKIAFIGYKKQERYSAGTQNDEDASLLNFLKEKGLDAEHVIWNDASVDWKQYSVAVLKSPWDYHEFFPEFLAWLDRTERSGIAFLNPHAVVRWNSDKHYLQDISKGGLPVITTHWFEKNTQPDLNAYFVQLNSEKLVIKPCISASAKNTLVVTRENVTERRELLHQLLREDSFVVQPFVDEIHQGELSFLFFGKNYSHAVLKLPRAGDFRVQHFHGGTVQSFHPSPEQIAAAARYVEHFANNCLYARVDGVLINGELRLMELELIEPFLFLDTHPASYQTYYEALVSLIPKNK